MKEYIEREAVNQIIAVQCGECADACLEFDGIQPDCNQCLLHGAKKAIESIPAADVRPVVRGKWNPNVPPRDLRPRCSVCGELQPQKTNFCPNCGADMREES
jgi:hypothetical protein